MNEELNIRPAAMSHVDVDRKASREYLRQARRNPRRRGAAKCGVSGGQV